MTYEQIKNAWLRGGDAKTSFNDLTDYFVAEGKSEAEAQNLAESTMKLWSEQSKVGQIPGQGGQGGNGLPSPTGLSMAETEKASDPFTAYRQAIGTGGKVNLNPAEQYQEDLFTPLMSLFNTNQRLYDPTSPLGKAGNVGKRYGNFSDYYGSVPAGEPGISATAGRMLGTVWGATPEQKATLGYEPGQVNRITGETGAIAGGKLDENNLGELEKLLRYGLVPTAGPLGARYAAQRLPAMQQAYWGQKTAGTQGAGINNFVDWIKANYPELRF